MRRWTVAIAMGVSLSTSAHVDTQSDLAVRASIVRQPDLDPFRFEPSPLQSTPRRDDIRQKHVIYYDALPNSSSQRIWR